MSLTSFRAIVSSNDGVKSPSASRRAAGSSWPKKPWKSPMASAAEIPRARARRFMSPRRPTEEMMTRLPKSLNAAARPGSSPR
jgi:hypothetical protein